MQNTVGVERGALGSCGALSGADGAAPRAELGPQRPAGRTQGGIRQRHPHVPVRTVALEPEQQVGRAAAGKAFRSKMRTCTMLPQALSPEGVSIRVRGNPARCRTPQATLVSNVHT